MRKNIILLSGNIIFLLFSNNFIHAQSLEEYHIYKEKYPEKIGIILENKQEVLIDYRADSVYIVQRDFERKLYLNSQAKMLSEDQVFISSFNKTISLTAKTFVPNKKNFFEIEVKDFYEGHDMSASVFYDDFKTINFTYPSLQEGSQSILEHVFEYENMRLFRSFYFGSYLPVVNSTFTLKVHKNITIHYKLFNVEGIKISFTQKQDGDYFVYQWKSENIKEYLRGNRIVGMQYILPHLVFYIGSITANNEEIKVLNTVDDLYNWYYSFVEDIHQDDQEELIKLVENLTNNAGSDYEKAKRIYYWVQDNINYIAFEQGMRGFIPSSAIEVFNQKYGDCKDMASILTSMLRLAGLESYFTWIGTRELPYSYNDLPTPSADNHMISTWIYNDSAYFLDATAKYTPFGIPSAAIQGKEALVGLGKNKYKIIKVPVLSKEFSGKTDSCFIYFNGKSIMGKGKIEYKGYTKPEVAYSIDGLQDEKLKERYITLLKRGNNKFFLTGYNQKGLFGKDVTLNIDYNFKIDDYFISLDDEIYFNLSLDKSFFNKIIEDTTNLIPVENDFYFTDNFYTKLIIPEGYRVSHVPSDLVFENDTLGFSIQYKVDENFIVQEKTIYFNFFMIKLENVNLWNKMVKEISKAYRESIIIKKVNDGEN